MKKGQLFAVSISLSVLWLGVSMILAAPWARSIAGPLPVFYIIFVIAGIALIPGYLMCAMFVSNLLSGKVPEPGENVSEPVTVLICARNEEKNVFRTIAHVVHQRYDGDITILCVDNGSTDGTRAEIRRAMERLSAKKRTIQYIFCEPPGKAYALNAGLREIETQYFLTVDADTLLEEHAVEEILQVLIHSGAACVAGNLLVQEPKTWVRKMQIYDYLISIAAVKRFQGTYGATLVAQGAFSAYETEAVQMAGGWTQSAGEDIVLTYKLLARGRTSGYAPRAVGYTVVPETLPALYRQRARWARGMFDGAKAVLPWRQRTFFGGYFESIALSIVLLDLSYVFGFLVGVVLLMLGRPWLVGLMTLLMLPQLLLEMGCMYRFQKRIPTAKIQNSLLGAVSFLLLFQTIQSLASLWGYVQAVTGRRPNWK